jgi:hypothetical protein
MILPFNPGWRIYRIDQCRYQPLSKGKYRVAFRLKIDSNVVREQVTVDTPVVELDVTSNDGQKYLAHRSLTIGDFLNSDDYQEFPLDFDLVRDENRLFCLRATCGAVKGVA